jgi:hypothetical protein
MGGGGVNSMAPTGEGLAGPAASIRVPKAGEIVPPSRPGAKVLPAKAFTVKLPTVSNRHLVASLKAVPHQPYPLVHGTTGQALNPNAVITLPDREGRRGKGRQMTVREFFAALNQTEQSLNSWGYSLRTMPASTRARTAASMPRVVLAQVRRSPSPLGLYMVRSTVPLDTYLGLKRVDLPEFPMEWAAAPLPLLYSMNWSPVHFLVHHVAGTKKLVWQVSSQSFADLGSDWKAPAGLIRTGEITDLQPSEFPRYGIKGRHTWQKIDFMPFLGMPDTARQLHVRFVALDGSGVPLSAPSRPLTLSYGNYVQPPVKIPLRQWQTHTIPSLELPGGDPPFGVFFRGGFDSFREIYDGKVNALTGGGQFTAGVRVYNPMHFLDSSKPSSIEVPIGQFRASFDPINNKLVFSLKSFDENKLSNPTTLLDPSSLLVLKEIDGFPKTQATALDLGHFEQPIAAEFEEDIPIYDGITLNLKFTVSAVLGVNGEVHKTASGLGVAGSVNAYAKAIFTASGSVHPPGLAQPHLDAIVNLIDNNVAINVNLQPEAGTVAFTGDNTISALQGSVVFGVDVMVPSPKKAVEGLWGVITFQDMTPDMPVTWKRVWHYDIFNQPDPVLSEKVALFE